MSVFEAVKPQIGQPFQGFQTPGGFQAPLNTQPSFGAYPYLQQQFGPLPYAQQQPFGPQQFAQQLPQPFMQQQQPFGPQPYAQYAQQPYTQQPFMQQQPFGPQPYAQQPYALQQPFGPQQFPQQPYGPFPGQPNFSQFYPRAIAPEAISPIVADVAARCAPHAIAAIVDVVRAEPPALAAIQATGQLPTHVYPMVLMEIANRIAPVLHAMLNPMFPGTQPNMAGQQPVQPMAYAGR